MKTHRVISLFFLSALLSMPSVAQREQKLLNANWNFNQPQEFYAKNSIRVDLPHTWNTQDALSGQFNYERGIGTYTKSIIAPEAWRNKRVFIRFEGANNVTNLLLNDKHVGEHRGGYGAFIFELTDLLKYGKKNLLTVRVNNSEQLDVMPLVGDFNIYGGLYRDVHLLITDKVCISPLDYASPGVYLTQKKVSEQQADITTRVLLSNSEEQAQPVSLRLQVKAGGKTVYETTKEVTAEPRTTLQPVDIDFSIEKPHLWNGTADPFLYTVDIALTKNGVETDRVSQPLGLRYYHTDPNEGFFLNGKHLALHGVCRHQDRAEIGNALRLQHHEEDVQIMREMGVNAARLAHYPQATAMYDLMDKNGIVVWAEIPFVGPGGYSHKGFINQDSFKENGKEQLKELIRQHYNHPSICFWGLFNELKEYGDNPADYIRELKAMAHQEDPTRPTTAASNIMGEIVSITDNIAWNRYDGWYGATPKNLAKFLDGVHSKYPHFKIGISEYGAGASIYQQQDTLVQSSPKSWWHPENWQTEYHIRNWEIISQRPYLWGTFVWNMFDFGAAHRREGDRPGINDKGLVTFDRKIRKDAFYFYKANWNPEPMVRIEGHRNVNRTKDNTMIQIFSNCEKVTLKVNGKEMGEMKPDGLKICQFKNIPLQRGSNLIEAIGKNGKKVITDHCEWLLNQ